MFYYFQGSLVHKWNGKPVYSGSRWSKLEGCSVSLPKDTLIDVEIVEELKGQVNIFFLIE